MASGISIFRLPTGVSIRVRREAAETGLDCLEVGFTK